MRQGFKRDEPEFLVSEQQSDIVDDAYTFALKHIGQDIGALSVWQDYIAFLASRRLGSHFAEAQKFEKIRAVYHQAIQVPMYGVENLWKEYEQFEAAGNKSNAKTFLAEMNPKNQRARQICRQRRVFREGISVNMLARPPARCGIREAEQHARWKRLLKFERSNISDDVNRITLAFRQCILCFYHHPDVWYDACRFLVESKLPDEAAKLFDKALAAVPESLIIHFACADFEESRNSIEVSFTTHTHIRIVYSVH
eukprot:c6287_g1_i2.p1 GENE.c6287_g1_i2~~c6287_g1_i2.p1  ORF type:complete len:254 (-),score=52.88 c6287_g1_i2:36-797(-)